MFVQINQNILKNPQENKSWYRDSDNNCDLFIWLDQQNAFRRFQLWHDDFLVEWDACEGLKSGQLDAREGSFHNLQAPSYHYHQTYLKEPIHKMLQFLEPIENSELEQILNFVRQILKYFGNKQ